MNKVALPHLIAIGLAVIITSFVFIQLNSTGAPERSHLDTEILTEKTRQVFEEIVPQTNKSHKSLTEQYTKNGSAVYFVGERIKGAHAETFVEIRAIYPFAKDRFSVYSGGKRIEGADPETFEVVYFDLAKDATYVYDGTTLLEGVDPHTLRRVADTNYLLDKDHVYIYSAKGLQMVGELDPDSFEIREECWAGDGYIEYYVGDDNGVYAEGKLISNNPDTFRTFASFTSGGESPARHTYATDGKVVVFQCKGIIEGADPQTFEIIGSGFSKDAQNVYRFKDVIEGVEPSDCTPETIDNCTRE